MRHLTLVCTLASLVVFPSVIASQATSGHAIFEQALAKERVEGNLPEAIKLYERVVAEFAADRALAAQALVQVGLCYEKLGRDEAVRAYERLVRDFADQEDAVDQARARLAVLKRSPVGQVGNTPTVRALPRVDNTNAVLALSPDGTKAAFLTFDKGQNLAVYDLASQSTTRLTALDWTNGFVDAAVWSPDGQRVAYMQCASTPFACELRASTVAGQSSGIFRNDAGLIVPAGWLPDSAAFVAMLGRADRTFTMGLVPVAGGSFTPLRTLNWTDSYPEASVSPDGRLIAFAEGAPGARDIYVMSPDGRAANRITDHPSDDRRPLWSPDGRHLAFLSSRNGSTALWTVSIKDGQPASEPLRVKDGMQAASLRGWTTRGLAYIDRVRTDDIYTVQVDSASSAPSGSPRQIPYPRTGRNVAPAWSPDDRYLAFVSSSPAEPDRRSVVVFPSGGSEPREFPIPTRHFRYLQEPYDLRWFGDSRGLGFSGYDARGDPTLFRLTLATGEWKTFPVPVINMTRIEWNANGNRHFYTRQNVAGQGPAVIERDLQSDRERIVFQEPADSGARYRGLRVSPNGRLLAINRGHLDRQGILQQDIVVLDIESGQTRVVQVKAAGDTPISDSMAVPTWSPSGRELLVLKTEKQATELRLIPTDGSEVRRITLGPELTRLLSPGRGAPRPTIESAVWSPDGSRLAFVLAASRVETFVIENPLALAGAPDKSARR